MLHKRRVKNRTTATMYYYRPAELSSFSVCLCSCSARVSRGFRFLFRATFLLNAVITIHAAYILSWRPRSGRLCALRNKGTRVQTHFAALLRARLRLRKRRCVLLSLGWPQGMFATADGTRPLCHPARAEEEDCRRWRGMPRRRIHEARGKSQQLDESREFQLRRAQFRNRRFACRAKFVMLRGARWLEDKRLVSWWWNIFVHLSEWRGPTMLECCDGIIGVS